MEGKRETGQERNTTDESKLLLGRILLSSCSLREQALGEVGSALAFPTLGFFPYPYEKKNLLISCDKQNIFLFLEYSIIVQKCVSFPLHNFEHIFEDSDIF